MANLKGRSLLDEEQARAAEERYARMEATLQELQQENQELQHHLQEQQNIIETERLHADRRVKSSDARICKLNDGALGGTTRA